LLTAAVIAIAKVARGDDWPSIVVVASIWAALGLAFGWARYAPRAATGPDPVAAPLPVDRGTRLGE
jgi:hypothetical protein